MAPILKELEAPAGAPSSSTPVAPKVQPVALEIPVTVNGARTVEGSDKRVPFSENTQTVLVLPHGAVIRTNTPLASGQLVFLTNEKTKKEVVCQVVKSKSTGSSGSYVELQFTEPAPGFWGLQLPGSAALPPGPRPVAPAVPPAPKAVAPPAPVPVKPAVTPEAISAPPAAKPAVLPPAPVAARPESIAPLVTAPPVQAIKPVPSATIPAEVHEAEPVKSVVPAPPVPKAPEIAEPSAPAASTSSTNAPEPAHHRLQELPKLHNYGKEIEALFAPPRPPATSPEPPANQPSTEDLKQQASRLQEQLSSMLFTQNQSPAPTVPVSNKAAEPPAAELPKPVEIAAPETKAIHNEPKPAPPVSKPAPVSLNAEEESVKIPSWLAPITQNSAASATTNTTESHESSSEQAVSNSEESYEAGDAPKRPQTAVFGGQLLGEAAAPAEETPAGGSKKGLIFGLIAATVVIAGGGWYYLQNYSGRPSVTPTHSVSASSTPESPAGSAASAPSASVPSGNKGNASPVAAQPPRNSAPAPAPATPAPQTRNAKPAQKNPEPPAPEEPEKPSLGEVHLSAPVVNHSENSQLDADGLQSVSTSSVPAGTDPFGAGHHNATAPIPVGGDVTPAQLVKSVPPEYPQIAKSQHISGKVTMDAVIDTAGNVASLKVVSGPALLHRAAMDAVKQWKYNPAILDGQPTTSHLAVTVEFRAQ
jgi:periplasmic protein TonB